MKITIRIFALMSLIFVPGALAKPSNSQFLNVSQGIAAPAITSPINYAHGFNFLNSAVAADYNGIQLSLEHNLKDDDSGNSAGSGAELGLGNGSVGLGLGYYKRDCDGCKGKGGAIAGFSTHGFAVGIGYREDRTASLGFLFNPSGSHRFALVGDFYDSLTEDGDDDIQSYGAGYAFAGNNFIFALDASKKAHKNTNVNDEVVMVSPGLLFSVDSLALSLSYDSYQNDKNNVYKDDAWFGIGFSFNAGSISIYHDYVSDWAFALALNF